VNQGWKVARATLGNERVSIGGSTGGPRIFDAVAIAALAERYAGNGADRTSELGAAIAEAHAMSVLNLRQIARALSGAGSGPGPEGNVSKLLAAEHAQRVAGLGMRLTGPEAVAGGEPGLTHDYLFTRCLTIAGGTSEIVRNLIAERILGLPRDPLSR
jgi:alkylation response protein AidB-like acyl-CoA dehydrogenase